MQSKEQAVLCNAYNNVFVDVTHPNSESERCQTLFVWDDNHEENFLKINEATNWTQYCSIASPLTDCTVINFATEAYKPFFCWLLQCAGRSTKAVISLQAPHRGFHIGCAEVGCIESGVQIWCAEARCIEGGVQIPQLSQPLFLEQTEELFMVMSVYTFPLQLVDCFCYRSMLNEMS